MSEFVGLRAGEILEMFPRCIPCDCYGNLVKANKTPKYNIRFGYGNSSYGARGRIICTMTICCDSCGLLEVYHVERLNVYEHDIKWKFTKQTD